ncbi:hypothetical protein IEQ34_011384 [Dendrobium chrysotoxum]|uniref:Uncharacterized protein n=1 Tax=Dendrobium chrysotoxum TaxID=161865 RepID=A0AAV7GVK7_DENCH|nr:hypothetical protein IEQ34_011384 [Dendrobium chrysotoxum]
MNSQVVGFTYRSREPDRVPGRHSSPPLYSGCSVKDYADSNFVAYLLLLRSGRSIESPLSAVPKGAGGDGILSPSILLFEMNSQVVGFTYRLREPDRVPGRYSSPPLYSGCSVKDYVDSNFVAYLLLLRSDRSIESPLSAVPKGAGGDGILSPSILLFEMNSQEDPRLNVTFNLEARRRLMSACTSVADPVALACGRLLLQIRWRGVIACGRLLSACTKVADPVAWRYSLWIELFATLYRIYGISTGFKAGSDRYEVVPNAKKFRYCGINPELEHKLDLMFMGVVATGVHAWTPNEGIDHKNVHGDSEQLDTTTNSFEDPSQSFDSISECSKLKRPSSTTSVGSRKKKSGSEFLRSQITQLVNSCTNINSGTNASQSIIGASLLPAAIKILEQTTEAFEDMPLYLFSTKLLEDPIKQEIFMTICPDRRVHYLRYCYENRDTTTT